jgi:hypothetical protein
VSSRFRLCAHHNRNAVTVNIRKNRAYYHAKNIRTLKRWMTEQPLQETDVEWSNYQNYRMKATAGRYSDLL